MFIPSELQSGPWRGRIETALSEGLELRTLENPFASIERCHVLLPRVVGLEGNVVIREVVLKNTSRDRDQDDQDTHKTCSL